MNPLLSSRATDLMHKDLVQMLRGGRELNSKYAVIDADRRMVHTAPPSAKVPKMGKLPGLNVHAPASGKLRKIFG